MRAFRKLFPQLLHLKDFVWCGLSAAAGSWKASLCLVPVWLPHAVGGPVLQKVEAVQDTLSTFVACEAFFSTGVLLALVRAYSEPEASPTCLILVWFLRRVISLTLSQV